jgi:hypothetical protein
LVTGIILLMLKEVTAFLTLKMSAQPGVLNIYKPFTGIFYFFGHDDPTAPRNMRSTDLITRHGDCKAIQFNHQTNPFSTSWYLHNPVTYKAFFMTGESHAVKVAFYQPREWKSFLFSSGHKALTERGIMNEFFLIDNMKDLAFRIQAIVNNHLDRMVSEKKLNNTDFVMVDWKMYSEVIFDEIVNLTLYGFKPEESKPEVFGTRLTVSHNTQRNVNAVSMSRVWNLATGNLFSRWLPGGGALAHKLRYETSRVLSACMATRRSEL